jgi:hypothetical protein
MHNIGEENIGLGKRSLERREADGSYFARLRMEHV